MKILAVNKRANFDYDILEKYEAGIVLFGHEVKSIRLGNVSLKESFVTIKGNELYLTNAHVTLYKHAGIIEGYEPTRPRVLLLRKQEIKKLIGKIRIEGLTLVPIKLYTKRHLLKLEFGLGRGKKMHDKRESIKNKETKRSIERQMKNID